MPKEDWLERWSPRVPAHRLRTSVEIERRAPPPVSVVAAEIAPLDTLFPDDDETDEDAVIRQLAAESAKLRGIPVGSKEFARGLSLQSINLAWQATFEMLKGSFTATDDRIANNVHRRAAIRMLFRVRRAMVDQVSAVEEADSVPVTTAVSTAQELRLAVKAWGRTLEQLEELLTSTDQEKGERQKERFHSVGLHAVASKQQDAAQGKPQTVHGYAWKMARVLLTNYSKHGERTARDGGSVADLLSERVVELDLTGLSEFLHSGVFERDEDEPRLGGGLLLGMQAAICLNPALKTIKLCGNALGQSAALMLWASVVSREVPTTLMLGFNSMPSSVADKFADWFDQEVSRSNGRLYIADLLGRPLDDALAISEALQLSKQAWVDPELFNTILRAHANESLRFELLKDAETTPRSSAEDVLNGNAAAAPAPDQPPPPSLVSAENGTSPSKAAQPSVRRMDSRAIINTWPTRYDASDEFAFHKAEKHKDGIYGLYTERGLNPDRLERSLPREFEENHGGGWLPEWKYVAEQRARSKYPSTKGKAPNPSSIAEYTRDWMSDGLSLDDFVARQPEELAKLDGGGLNRCEVATLRLYTGPVFEAWNGWLRGVPYREGSTQKKVPKLSGEALTAWLAQNNWATSVAVLNNAVLKLSQITTPNVVYRGVREQHRRLPDYFLPEKPTSQSRFLAKSLAAGIKSPAIRRQQSSLRKGTFFAGGVEKAFMSTSEDPETAFKYSGPVDMPGAIFQIRFDLGTRAADVQWCSQYPAEKELLFAPYCSLTVDHVQEVGHCKLLLDVKATISTRRPNVDWCVELDSEPESKPVHPPEALGPFQPVALDFKSFAELSFFYRPDLQNCELPSGLEPSCVCPFASCFAVEPTFASSRDH